MRWLIRLFFLAMGLAGIFLLFPPVRQAAWTTLFLADFLAGQGSSPFKLLTSAPLETSHTLLIGDTLAVPFDLYRPPSVEPAPALLFTHGLAHRGKEDPRVRSHSRRLARSGFVVMAPDLEQMKHYRLDFRDVEATIASVDYLRHLDGVDSTRIGVVAPSFGAGPVLIALSRPQVRDRVRFALVFGGYYDLKRTLRYTLTGAYEAEGYAGQIDVAANRHNRWKFLRGNARLLPPSPSREQYLRFASAKIDSPLLDIRPLLSDFSQEEQRALIFMDNEDPARFDSLYAALPASIHAWIDTFSLHHYTQDLRASLLIAHSRADDKVSFTESLALSRNLPNAPEPLVVIVGLFAHVDLKLKWESLEVVRKEVLPGLLQLWSLAHHLLGQQRH
jgi:hypothetical protein